GQGAARRRRRSSIGCAERDGAIAHSAIDAAAGAVWIQFFIGRIRSRNWRTEHLHRDVRQPQAARYDDEDLLHRQRRRCHGPSQGNRRRTRYYDNAKNKLEVTTGRLFGDDKRAACAKATRGRVRTPKAYAKQNNRLAWISHKVLWSAMRPRI